MRALGLDTSNYTTSSAVFDGREGLQAGKLLQVPAGTLGLRQSEALFQHVKALPERMEELKNAGALEELVCVAASTRPRAVEGSYMPCFLAGENLGRSLAAAMALPFFAVSHQQGHLAAAAWSSGEEGLLDRPFLAWHLSGGTTELLYVEPEGRNVRCEKIGGTEDISAGQLIDRTGVLLGKPFPAGKAVDALARGATERKKPFPVKLRGLDFSLSGMENKVKALAEAGEEPEVIAAFVLDTVSTMVRRCTLAALEERPGLSVLFSGGVASNSRLREVMEKGCDARFAQPVYSTDNAVGVAILGRRLWEEQQEKSG